MGNLNVGSNLKITETFVIKNIFNVYKFSFVVQ